MIDEKMARILEKHGYSVNREANTVTPNAKMIAKMKQRLRELMAEAWETGRSPIEVLAQRARESREQGNRE